jgi:hypothetical protein
MYGVWITIYLLIERTRLQSQERTSNASLVKRIKILVHDLRVYGNLIRHNS